jgi:hypothetical protein
MVTVPDPKVAPEDLRLIAEHFAKLADEVKEPMPWSWVLGQLEDALGVERS